MMIGSGGGMAAADASVIISDLRSMKAAVMMFYASSMDDALSITLNAAYLKPYMDNPGKYDGGEYLLHETLPNNKWWVGYDLDAARRSKTVKDKLEGKARSVGLLGDTDVNVIYAGGPVIWMAAR
jgi:hypothetical protein